jgi:hypothetical protein
MRETIRAWTEATETFVLEVIFEQRAGKLAALVRSILFGLSKVFQVAVKARRFLYNVRILRDSTLGVQVIAIGNLTVGGTGRLPSWKVRARAAGTGAHRCDSFAWLSLNRRRSANGCSTNSCAKTARRRGSSRRRGTCCWIPRLRRRTLHARIQSQRRHRLVDKDRVKRDGMRSRNLAATLAAR